MTPKFSEKAEARIEQIKKQYPDARSAAMAALYICQEELGFLDERAVQWTAAKTGIAPVHVQELITFYTMYYQKPVGRYHFQVCRTLSCAVRDSRKLTETLQKRFGTKPREVTKDGMFSYEEVECLGSCGSAPMCEINDCFFENLNPEKLIQIIEQIEKEKPNLRLSTLENALGEGLKGHPKSRVME